MEYLAQFMPDVFTYTMPHWNTMEWSIERWWSAQGLACRKEESVGNLSSLASYYYISIYL